MNSETEDWCGHIGKTVELRSNGKLVRTGEVEDVTKDSTVLWLRFDGAEHRQLVAKSDGYTIRPLT